MRYFVVSDVSFSDSCRRVIIMGAAPCKTGRSHAQNGQTGHSFANGFLHEGHGSLSHSVQLGQRK
jgi:hypothetical protein